MDGQMDARMDGWMDGGVDAQKLYNQGISSFLSLPLIST